MLIGYTRVSTDDQHLELQHDALTAAGCERIFEDRQSGAKADRPGLAQTLEFAREGDTVVVWRLDRLGRSLPELIRLVELLNQRGIAFRSLGESIDASTSSGRLIFHVFAALAQFERDLIRERTAAGLAAARKRGRRSGRPPRLTDRDWEAGKKLLADGMTVTEVARLLKVDRATIYRRREKDRQANIERASSNCREDAHSIKVRV